MSAPARLGPITRVEFIDTWASVMALTRCSRPASSAVKARRDGAMNAKAVPCMPAEATSIQNCS